MTGEELKKLPDQLRSIAETSARMFKWGRAATIFIAVGGTATAIGLYTTYQTILQTSSPTTTLYQRIDKQGVGEKTPIKDPKLEVKFGNIGNAPMFVKSFELLEGDAVIPSIADAIRRYEQSQASPLTFVVSSDSSYGLSKRYAGNHPVAASPNPMPLCTIRPKSDADVSKPWDEDFARVAKECGLRVRVTYGNGLKWPFGVEKVDVHDISKD